MKTILIILVFPFCIFGQKTVKYLDPNQHPDTIKKRTMLINKIFLSDSLCVALHSFGCFHNHVSKYFIVKENDSYHVLYIDNNGVPTKNKNIDNQKRKSLQDICIKGLSVGLGLCTTKDKIYISDKDNKTYFIDARCSETDDYIDKINKLLQ